KASTGTAIVRPSFPTTSFTSFILSIAEPAAMDVDAIYIHDKFLCQMCKRCFDCGLTVHFRRDSNHNYDLCKYCKKVEHQEIVCMAKFLKRAEGQKVA
ncbi:hypothetical protein BGY98DRAFT_888081, partial [Russula aff. rugulosa BPL654]